MPAKIVNISTLALPLPAPYFGVLKGGQAAVVADGVSAAQQALGGAAFMGNVFQTIAMPSGAALTPHGQPNVDETLLGATAAVNLNVHSSRFDVVGGVGSATATVAPGLFAGQQHRFYMCSQTGASVVSIVPSAMWENRQAVKLNALGAFATLEWQLQGVSGPASGGWKLIDMGGPTGGAVSLV